jgi:hypothetical protein
MAYHEYQNFEVKIQDLTLAIKADINWKGAAFNSEACVRSVNGLPTYLFDKGSIEAICWEVLHMYKPTEEEQQIQVEYGEPADMDPTDDAFQEVGHH